MLFCEQEMPGKRSEDHPCSHGLIGLLIDEDEAAGYSVLFVAIVEEGGRSSQTNPADVVELECKVVFDFVECVDVYFIINSFDQGFYFT